MSFRPAATGTEARLEAILEELRGIRALLEDRHLVRVIDERIDEKLGEVADVVRHADAAKAVEPAVKPPTKRTRTRAPRTAGS